jgi:hypothetical protein
MEHPSLPLSTPLFDRLSIEHYQPLLRRALREHMSDDAREMLAKRVLQHLQLWGFEIDEDARALRRKPPRSRTGRRSSLALSFLQRRPSPASASGRFVHVAASGRGLELSLGLEQHGAEFLGAFVSRHNHSARNIGTGAGGRRSIAGPPQYWFG